MKRRQFVKYSAACVAGLGSAWLSRSAAASDAIPRSKRSRIAATTTQLREMFRAKRSKNTWYEGPDITLLDVPGLYADKVGIQNLELRCDNFEETSASYCEKLLQSAEKAGSKIVNLQLTTGLSNLAHADPEGRKKSIAAAKDWMRRAADLGAPSIRADIGHTRGHEFDMELVIDSFQQLAPYGEKIGVCVLIENHMTTAEVPEKLIEILKAVDSPAMGTEPDFGNLPEGRDEAFRHRTLRMLFPHAKMVSAKGEWFDEQGRHVPYDIGACVRIGEASGYQGVYSCEYYDKLNRPFDPLEATRRIAEIVAANLRSSLATS